MNRRSFIQAAALSTADRLKSKGPNSSSHPPVRTHPVEVDLAAPDATRHVGNSAIDLYVRLEELYPADDGQLSGLSLRIMNGGRLTVLNVECAALQRDGGQNIHCYGVLDYADLAHVAVAETFMLRLRESYPKLRSDFYNDVVLTLFAGRELQVCFGNHCLGVLRGDLLTRFLDCVRQRTEDRAIV